MKLLWDRLRQDEVKALELLYEQTYSDLLSYGVQLCNNLESSKDAINDIFLNLWENRTGLKSVENVRAYLFACMRRKIFELKSNHQKRSSLENGLPVFGEEADLSHEDILIAMQQTDETRTRIQKALGKLTERQRELIRMKFFNGMDYREIEDETGISVKTAYNTIYNAMKVLSGELQLILFILVDILT